MILREKESTESGELLEYDRGDLMCLPRLGHTKDGTSSWLSISISLSPSCSPCPSPSPSSPLLSPFPLSFPFSLPLSFHGCSPMDPRCQPVREPGLPGETYVERNRSFLQTVSTNLLAIYMSLLANGFSNPTQILTMLLAADKQLTAISEETLNQN